MYSTSFCQRFANNKKDRSNKVFRATTPRLLWGDSMFAFWEAAKRAFRDRIGETLDGALAVDVAGFLKSSAQGYGVPANTFQPL